MENTYKIPVQFLDSMNAKLKKLNKKDLKLGLEEIKIEVLETESDNYKRRIVRFHFSKVVLIYFIFLFIDNWRYYMKNIYMI